MGQCLDSTATVMAGPLDCQHHLRAGVTMAVQGTPWLKLAGLPPTFRDKL